MLIPPYRKIDRGAWRRNDWPTITQLFRWWTLKLSEQCSVLYSMSHLHLFSWAIAKHDIPYESVKAANKKKNHNFNSKSIHREKNNT